ncbi:MAG: hypothetical protein IJO48_03140 [Clostridia bacterium]|nr:hypothetical protein [Clostridia bacterium]
MKTEYTTSLHGNEFVRKDDPQIEFRGLLDSAMAQAAFGASIARFENKPNLEKGFCEIERGLMEIMSGHYKCTVVKLSDICGKDAETLHKMSHNPQKYFSTTQFIPTPEQGMALAYMNVLRTRIRDAERALIACYKDCENEQALSLIQAMNRLSSAAFVIMCEENQNK